MNLLTMQQEAPPEHHWQHVLLQLQPTEQQLLQLSAGHVLFRRLCTGDQQAQRAAADAVSTANSCSLLVLTALSSAPSSSSTSSEPTSSSSSGPDSNMEGLGSLCDVEQAGAVTEAASADAQPASAQPSDPVISMETVLRRLTHTSGLLHMLMINTLTREQIARLVVVSSPFAPRSAPLMEAAHLLVQQSLELRQQLWSGQVSEPPQLLNAWLATAPRPETQAHSDRRTQLLQVQVQDWWSSIMQQEHNA